MVTCPGKIQRVFMVICVAVAFSTSAPVIATPLSGQPLQSYSEVNKIYGLLFNGKAKIRSRLPVSVKKVPQSLGSN